MKLRKVIAAYFYDLAQDVESEKVSDDCVKGLMHAIMQIEEHKEQKKEESSDKSITEKAAEEIKKDREESIEDCLPCELANMLGIGGDLTQPGEFPMSAKPTIKIKIKKISTKDDLNKVLKGLRDGGVVDLNTINDQLGDTFDLNSLQEILETPMFKKGGSVNGSNIEPQKTLPKQESSADSVDDIMRKFNCSRDQALGLKPIEYQGQRYFIKNGRPAPADPNQAAPKGRPRKHEEGGEVTLEEFLND